MRSPCQSLSPGFSSLDFAIVGASWCSKRCYAIIKIVSCFFLVIFQTRAPRIFHGRFALKGRHRMDADSLYLLAYFKRTGLLELKQSSLFFYAVVCRVDSRRKNCHHGFLLEVS